MYFYIIASRVLSKSFPRFSLFITIAILRTRLSVHLPA